MFMRTSLYLAYVGASCLVGCKDEGKKDSGTPTYPIYSLPREKPAPGWRKAPESSVRSASFVIEGSKGAVADVSLVIQPGLAGGLLQNVNSWRIQLGQPVLNQTGFERSARWLTTPVGDGVVIDITGMAKGADPAFDGRVLAVIVEQATQTWFFKMRGNAQLVEAQADTFFRWVLNIQAAESGYSAAAIPPEPAPTVPVMQVHEGHKATWEIPGEWTQAPDSTTFLVKGPRGTNGEVSVAVLAGAGGGPLANVNRWRQQAGLPPIAAQDLAGLVQSAWAGGSPISIVRIAGPKCSTMAAWTNRDDGTWLFKLTGPAVLLDAEQANFAGFLRSIEFTDP